VNLLSEEWQEYGHQQRVKNQTGIKYAAIRSD
jgi:hypothetical protein